MAGYPAKRDIQPNPTLLNIGCYFIFPLEEIRVTFASTSFLLSGPKIIGMLELCYRFKTLN